VTTGGAATSQVAARSAAADMTASPRFVGPVGVVVALLAEARCLARKRLRVGQTTPVGADLLLCVGGIGSDAAAAASRALLEAGAHALVSWGVAAGIDPALASGTLLLSSRAVTVMGTAEAGSALCETASRAWLDRLHDRLSGLIPIARGPVAAVDHLLRTVIDKRDLARLGAPAADMESGGIAAVARAAGVPWIAMRAISDTADDVVPQSVLSSVDRAGQIRAHQLVSALLARPSDIACLPALARGFRAALKTLRTVAQYAGPALLAPGTDGGSGDTRDRSDGDVPDRHPR
jgi:adenosylhomocysteine nucleosidase